MTDEEASLLRQFLDLFSADVRRRMAVVADRGFAKIELMKILEGAGVAGAIRLPRHHHVQVGSTWVALADMPMAAVETRAWGAVALTREHRFPCRLAARRLATGEANDPDDDTWYLATNATDPAQSLSW